MEPKIALLFTLFGVIIGLSHLDGDNLRQIRRRFAVWRWRKMPLPRFKS